MVPMRFFHSLKCQVTSALTLVLILIIGASVWKVIDYQGRVLDSLSDHQATAMANAVESWVSSLMLLHRGKELQGYLEGYAPRDDIIDVKIVRMDGRVTFASDPAEVGNALARAVSIWIGGKA